MSKRSEILSGIGLLLGLAAVPVGADSTDPKPRHEVRVVEFREVPTSGSREFVLEARRPGETTPLQLVLSGPYKNLAPDRPPSFKVVDHRLLAYTDSVLAVFDLRTGKQELWRVAIPPVTPTDDGKKVAYIEHQRPFTPPEASSMIVNVIDVETLAVRTVFPEAEGIAGDHGDLRHTWEEDPSKRCSLDRLFWSPEGSDLLFFCRGGDAEMSFVLVTPGSKLESQKSIYTRRPLLRQTYSLNDSEPKATSPLFCVETVTWLDARKIEVEPCASTRPAQRKFILELDP